MVRALEPPAVEKAGAQNQKVPKYRRRPTRTRQDSPPSEPFNHRQNAQGGRRYQEVHRDLPSEGRFLRADQEEQEGTQCQVQGPVPEVPVHPGAQGHGKGREAEAEPAPQPANYRPLQEKLGTKCGSRRKREGDLGRGDNQSMHEWASRDTLHFLCSEHALDRAENNDLKHTKGPRTVFPRPRQKGRVTSIE